MRTISILVALAFALALASCGDDASSAKSSPKRVAIKGERTSGKRAIATAKGFVDDPASIAVRVSSAPPQRTAVSWGISCLKNETQTSEDDKTTSGSYATTPPNERTLRLPDGEFAVCAVNAQVRLSRRGRVKVAILGNDGAKDG